MTVHATAAFEPSDVIRMVREGQTELGLIGTPEPSRPPGVGIVPIETQRFALITPAGWSLPSTDPLDLGSVAELRMIVSPSGSLMRTVIDDAIAAGAGLQIVAEVAHRTSILPFVHQGIGAAVVPSAWGTVARAAGLTVTRLSHPARLHVALLRRPGLLTPAAAAFVTQARAYREHLRSHPNGDDACPRPNQTRE